MPDIKIKGETITIVLPSKVGLERIVIECPASYARIPGFAADKIEREHSQFVPHELKTVWQGGYLTMIWRESCNFPGFQPGGNRIAGAQRRRMQRGQESPWLKFMENKGRSLIEWSENHPAGQLTI